MADIVAVSNAEADAAGIPRLLLLAAAVAESNLNPTARRPTDPSRDAAFWTDVSHGAWQQTVRWSREYQEWYVSNDHPPATFPGSAITEAIGSLYYDVEHAASVAARQLKAHYRPGEDDAIFKALCRYNWPAGNGAPKGAAQAANYRRGISEATALLESQPVPSTIQYEDVRGQPAGRFATTPKGIVLHGSRSGRAGNPKDAEYRGTANWAKNNPEGLSWHATISEGKVAVHLDPKEWAWHCRAASRHYIGVEIAQATIDDPITDAQIVALADYIKTRITPVWGNLDFHFPTHSELELWGETGQRDGKSDIYPAGDSRTDAVRNRLYALLGAPGAEPAPDPALPPSPPAPTLVGVRARLVALTNESDDRILGRYFREQIADIVADIPAS